MLIRLLGHRILSSLTAWLAIVQTPENKKPNEAQGHSQTSCVASDKENRSQKEVFFLSGPLLGELMLGLNEKGKILPLLREKLIARAQTRLI